MPFRYFKSKIEDGELTLGVKDDHYGDALYSFIQALLKISDVSYLSRERVRSTFIDDFRSFFAESILEDRRAFDWHDPQLDPQGMYTVDCRINGLARPLYVYALDNDRTTRDATISLLRFREVAAALPFPGDF